jgi:RNA polymerase-binding transcription factor DksA
VRFGATLTIVNSKVPHSANLSLREPALGPRAKETTMNALTRQQRQQIETILLARRNACLEQAVEERVRDHSQSFADIAGEVPDVGDESVARMLSDLGHTLAERHTDEIAAIDRTLAHMNAGGFGLCDECDGEIGYPRLRAFPTATRCIACQTVHERTYAHMSTPTL